MRRRGKATAMCAVASLAAAFALFAEPACAQGLFENILSGFRRAFELPSSPANIHAYSEPTIDPLHALNRPPERTVAGGTGLATVYCVRTCDGHYFPVQAHAGLSVGQACHAFCPASETRIYHGRTIGTAVARDGRRYADLPTAFAYRKHLVAGCTCNGRDAFGLAHIDPQRDPTLRPGDVVATRDGLVAFTGGKNGNADFTPVQDYSHFSKSYRDKLSAMRIAPPTPGAPGEFTSFAPSASDNRTAQLLIPAP
jgi:hypothetical protein